MAADVHIDAGQVIWRLGATLFFVALNGFFVAAEFALVKVRATRISSLIKAGDPRAPRVAHVMKNLDLYLSSCQLGITVASLILGWLAEPAVAQALLAGVHAVGWEIEPGLLHGLALAVALMIVTILHMTLGEQAPKIWAITNPELGAMRSVRILTAFTLVLRPLIWLVNTLSNGLLRLIGLAPDSEEEHAHTAEEIREILASSARTGQITERQWAFARNILGFMDLEVRHVLVPRIDVAFVDVNRPTAESLKTIRDSGHSRFPLCDPDLDHVVGVVHTKDLLRASIDGVDTDLAALGRKIPFVPDTQPLGRLIVELQRHHTEAAIVVDEHGTTVGMAFLEDALEEIVGPIQDEFDVEDPRVQRPGPGIIEMHAELSLPEASALLEIDAPDEHDTIGGYLTATLGRLPRQGERLMLGNYTVTVSEATERRLVRLRFEAPVGDEGGTTVVA